MGHGTKALTAFRWNKTKSKARAWISEVNIETSGKCCIAYMLKWKVSLATRQNAKSVTAAPGLPYIPLQFHSHHRLPYKQLGSHTSTWMSNRKCLKECEEFWNIPQNTQNFHSTYLGHKFAIEPEMRRNVNHRDCTMPAPSAASS